MVKKGASAAVVMVLVSLMSSSCIAHVGSAWSAKLLKAKVPERVADVELFAAAEAQAADAELIAGAPDESWPAAESPAMPPMTKTPPPLHAPERPRTSAMAAPVIKALPDFLPLKLPPFPWWALPIPSKSLPWSDPDAGLPHFPILDNLFLLLKVAESCFNCTYFLSVDSPLLLSLSTRALDLSPENLGLIYYQVVPFRLPFAALAPLPLAFRIPSFLNGSYLLVTRSASSFPRDNFVSLNYQRLLAPDLFVSDSMVIHGISGFLAPFTLAIPFPSTT